MGPYLTKSVEGDRSDASFITVLLRNDSVRCDDL